MFPIVQHPEQVALPGELAHNNLLVLMARSTIINRLTIQEHDGTDRQYRNTMGLIDRYGDIIYGAYDDREIDVCGNIYSMDVELGNTYKPIE